MNELEKFMFNEVTSSGKKNITNTCSLVLSGSISLCVNVRPRVTTDIRGFLRDCWGVGLTKGHTRGVGD